MRPMKEAGEINGDYCPVIAPDVICRAIKTQRARLDADGELERRCSWCDEFWPADTEFFQAGNTSFGLHCYCKACFTERRKAAKERRKESAEAAA